MLTLFAWGAEVWRLHIFWDLYLRLRWSDLGHLRGGHQNLSGHRELFAPPQQEGDVCDEQLQQNQSTICATVWSLVEFLTFCPFLKMLSWRGKLIAVFGRLYHPQMLGFYFWQLDFVPRLESKGVNFGSRSQDEKLSMMISQSLKALVCQLFFWNQILQTSNSDSPMNPPRSRQALLLKG